MSARYTVEGHTVEPKKAIVSGQPYWVIKDASSGNEVARISIYASTNCENFCRSQSGLWSVTAVGPDYLREKNRVVADEEYGLNAIRAEKAARNTHGTFNASGKCCRVSDGVSRARAVVRDQAFPWVRRVLSEADVLAETT